MKWWWNSLSLLLSLSRACARAFDFNNNLNYPDFPFPDLN